jgi:hypothetical protein
LGGVLNDGLAEALSEAGDNRMLVFFIGHDILFEVEPLEPRGGEYGLDDSTLDPREHANTKAQEVLVSGQWGGADGHTSILD